MISLPSIVLLSFAQMLGQQHAPYTPWQCGAHALCIIDSTGMCWRTPENSMKFVEPCDVISFVQMLGQPQANWIKYCFNSNDDPIACPKSAEPVDVPAVEETQPFGCLPPDSDKGYCTIDEIQARAKAHWTCRDKSNILLTSEDGKHWCHRVQQ